MYGIMPRHYVPQDSKVTPKNKNIKTSKEVKRWINIKTSFTAWDDISEHMPKCDIL